MNISLAVSEMLSTTSAFAALLATLTLSNFTSASNVVNNVHYTFYGFPDNSPPGPATAYTCGLGRGYTAGGDGSYDNPLTMATAPGEYDRCEIVWSPYVRKYLIFQDTCAACTDDFENGIKHVDLWLGSPTHNARKDVKRCERALTPDEAQTIVRDPGRNREADSKLRVVLLQVDVMLTFLPF